MFQLKQGLQYKLLLQYRLGLYYKPGLRMVTAAWYYLNYS